MFQRNANLKNESFNFKFLIIWMPLYLLLPMWGFFELNIGVEFWNLYSPPQSICCKALRWKPTVIKFENLKFYLFRCANFEFQLFHFIHEFLVLSARLKFGEGCLIQNLQIYICSSIGNFNWIAGDIYNIWHMMEK